MDRGGEEPMPISPMDRNPAEPAVPADRRAAPPTRPGRRSIGPPRRSPRRTRPPGSIRTATAFLAALEALGPRGGILKIAADADLALPASELKGPGRVILQADDGAGRPLLRFRPSRADSRPHGATARDVRRPRRAAWSFRALDVVLESAFAPERGDWCAFRVLGRGRADPLAIAP